MRIGLSTLYLINKPFKRIEEAIAISNVKYWEIADEGDSRLNRRRIKKLIELGKSFDVQYAVHAPFADINMASLNATIRRTVLKQLEYSLQRASILDSSLWIVHPGAHSGLSHYYPGRDYEICLESIVHLAKKAEDLGLTVAVENMPTGFQCLFVRADEFREHICELGYENVKICFDVGHANTAGQIDDFLDILLGWIVHVHAHDNDGSFDSHLPIGKGNVDWRSLLTRLSKQNYEGNIVVETLDDPMRDLKEISTLCDYSFVAKKR